MGISSNIERIDKDMANVACRQCLRKTLIKI